MEHALLASQVSPAKLDIDQIVNSKLATMSIRMWRSFISERLGPGRHCRLPASYHICIHANIAAAILAV